MTIIMHRAAAIFATLSFATIATPVFAVITTFISQGTTCSGTPSISASSPTTRFAPGGASVQVSVCMTATTESVCGFTLQLEADVPSESARFSIVGRKLGPNYPGATIERMPAAVAIKNPISREDFGGIRPEPGNPLPPTPNQLLATFTLAPLANAKNAAYSIRVGKGSMVAVAQNGSCELTDEVSIAGSFRLERN